MSAPPLSLRVKAITWEAPDIHSYDLRPLTDAPLPPFEPGAHIDLHLINGMVRSYSLINASSERQRYMIAVQKDRASRGGSAWIHANVRPGDTVSISGPRNNFALASDSSPSVLIAGGIGITPILAMTR
jgi:vanillate O-demethylase ferredoxin subunit